MNKTLKHDSSSCSDHYKGNDCKTKMTAYCPNSNYRFPKNGYCCYYDYPCTYISSSSYSYGSGHSYSCCFEHQSGPNSYATECTSCIEASYK